MSRCATAAQQFGTAHLTTLKVLCAACRHSNSPVLAIRSPQEPLCELKVTRVQLTDPLDSGPSSREVLAPTCYICQSIAEALGAAHGQNDLLLPGPHRNAEGWLEVVRLAEVLDHIYFLQGSSALL